MASACFFPGTSLFGQSADPEARLQWLKSRMPPAAAPAPAAPSPEQAKSTPAAPKVGFRSSFKGVGTRPVELQRQTPAKPAPEATPKVHLTATLTAKSTPVPFAKVKAATTTPTPIARVTAPPPGKSTSLKPPATPTPEPVASKTRIILTSSKSTSTTKPSLAPAIIAIPESRESREMRESRITTLRSETPTTFSNTPSGRYPWKTNIVTTIFWIGEVPSGNNPTPNHASSWDINWARNYGGFDNPDPSARRNYIPIRFTPRQNPFYVALPYNDVTRGTTKPESRRVIPWFKEAHRREGQSVCRDRWVAIRGRSGKVAYAQWSDCGPFRTDHWQYVFGSERPKPNLNKGAGLDVSPAVRDYLGLSSTDITDWKFVDFKDVPRGPWALHGDNNTFVLQRSRAPKSASRESGRTADNTEFVRLRKL